MKIALIGYGKMGHAIERHALERGHEIVCRVDADNIQDIDSEAFAGADVAIEFTMPKSALDNCLRAMSHGVPVVSGTTGWNAELPRAKAVCDAGEGTLLWSSNFSIGVNLFMALNKYLAAMMKPFPQYHVSMNEVHHIHKLDHPSGTAITLAQGIMEADPDVKGWTEEPTDDRSQLVISHERRGEVPGIHSITWNSPVDSITITHDAKSRDGFALGAVMAAEWLAGKKGFHTIDEFIQDLIK
ncbi:MAG: NAD(P)-binding domain-containing protein [Muribaculaceae bacterium]|nr:NAD(P)-binding domain-containing protein [Muribaculaceae bacterium]